MEEYRSGRNGPDSKSGWVKAHVGSNPTSSAKFLPVFLAKLAGFFCAKMESVSVLIWIDIACVRLIELS